MGLIPALTALLVELDGSREHAVVGDGQRRHAELHRAADHVLYLAGSVQRRVVGVHVQMAEAAARGPAGRCRLITLDGAVFHRRFGRR